MIKTLNPDWVRAVRERVNLSPYFSLQSMEIKELGWGTSRVEIALEEKHLQPFGNVHGGVFSSLVDAAGFWACYTELDPGLGMITVELKLNYLAPAKEGLLVGLGRSIKLGRTLGLADVRLEDGKGRLLAHGITTLMVMPDLRLRRQDHLPDKFPAG